jgi:CPA2 family monovalent cation:H+ antiporter-2
VGGALVFGLSLSVASTVVLLRALEDRKELDTANGRIAVGWLVVEDHQPWCLLLNCCRRPGRLVCQARLGLTSACCVEDAGPGSCCRWVVCRLLMLVVGRRFFYAGLL